MDSFFKQGFKASKCRTLLKLSIPRIKLLRNRREILIKNMRREIAKLLETGQEATARIKVEHIIREEKMMAAQEIIELFCELVTVRLPIIEAQRECPLDLKEAISSICFAAPRCADLIELLQVQTLFAGKYGKEFVAAATELRPECGVNRQLIEMLSIRAPPPDVKLKMLKEIAEEHQLDWDPSASETELLKPHEDLLNGPVQFISEAKMPLQGETHDEHVNSAPEQVSHEDSDSEDFETIDFPDVPAQPLRPTVGTNSAPEMLPFPESALSDSDDELAAPAGANDSLSQRAPSKDELMQEKSTTTEYRSVENKQFLPFISPPSSAAVPSYTVINNQSPPASPAASVPSSSTIKNSSPPTLRPKSDMSIDLQDVLAAAQAAADSAECAAAAARSAASLAQLRINEIEKRKKDDEIYDASGDEPPRSDTYTSVHPGNSKLGNANSFSESEGVSSPWSRQYIDDNDMDNQETKIPSYDDLKPEVESSPSHISVSSHGAPQNFQRSPSMDDEPYFSYPNLFTSQGTGPVSRVQSFTDNSKKTQE